MKSKPSMGRRLAQIFHGLQHFVDHFWYPPLLGFFCMADLVILIIPLDALLVSSILLRPRKWISVWFYMTGGAILGAFFIAILIQWHPTFVKDGLFHATFHSHTWLRTENLVHHWGIAGLVFLGLSPVPQQFPVLVAAFAGIPAPELALSVGLGRFLKYGIYCWTTAFAPKLLQQIPFLRKEMERIQALQVSGE